MKIVFASVIVVIGAIQIGLCILINACRFVDRYVEKILEKVT